MINIEKIEKLVKLISKDGDYMDVVLFICGVAHCGYLLLFYFLGIQELFIFNIFSVVAYMFIFSLARNKKHTIAYVLTYIEILMHQLYGIYIMGPDAGFDLLLCCLFLFQFSFFSRKTCFYLSIFLLLVIYWYFLLGDDWIGYSDKYIHTPGFNEIFDMLYYINEGVLISFIIVYALLASLISSSKIEDLKYLVYHDKLTGLRNRKYLEDVLMPSMQNGSSLICICDIDNFKNINDKSGHDVGDVILKRLGLLFERVTSELDVDIVRWGGEEFFIYGKFANKNACVDFLHSLQNQINNNHIKQINSNITLTFGALYINNLNKERFATYFKKADELLYKGKNSGKNTIAILEV